MADVSASRYGLYGSGTGADGFSTSLHPFGTLVEELGPIGDPEVETSALLKDCNFPTEEFPDQALKCLPPTPWT
jgi:exoribonuclease R